MHGPMPQHRFTTGRHLWVVMTVALGLALGTQAIAAKECQRETPLPADVRLIAPGSFSVLAPSRRRTSGCHRGLAAAGPDLRRRSLCSEDQGLCHGDRGA